MDNDMAEFRARQEAKEAAQAAQGLSRGGTPQHRIGGIGIGPGSGGGSSRPPTSRAPTPGGATPGAGGLVRKKTPRRFGM